MALPEQRLGLPAPTIPVEEQWNGENPQAKLNHLQGERDVMEELIQGCQSPSSFWAFYGAWKITSREIEGALQQEPPLPSEE